MSLATRCPACGTVFRVVQDQLKVSQGWVRCGQCHEVFNALESLFELGASAPPLTQGLTPPAAPVPAPEPTPPAPAAAPLAPPAAPAVPAPEPAPITPAPAPALVSEPPPPPAPPAPSPAPPPPAAAQAPAAPPASAPPAPAPASTEPLRGYELTPPEDDEDDAPDTDALAAPFGASRLPTAWEKEALQPAPAPETEVVPSFLRQVEPHAPWRRPALQRFATWTLCALLTLLLTGQLALQLRDRLTSTWPASRPVLEGLCRWAGCVVGPPMALDQIVLDNSQLQSTPVDGQLLITAELRNRAAVAVRRPALELTLTSDEGLVLARRVLQPTDLGVSAQPWPAQGSWHVEVRLEVAPLKVSGYSLEVFYP